MSASGASGGSHHEHGIVMALHARPLLISKFAMASVGDIAATIHHDERPPVKWPPSANVGIGGCASPQPIVRGRSHCTFGRTPTPFWRNLSGFPATRIDGELYWDGGILSNTPTEAVFDDDPRKDSLIFAVHLWNPSGAEPTTMAEVLNRHNERIGRLWLFDADERPTRRRDC